MDKQDEIIKKLDELIDRIKRLEAERGAAPPYVPVPYPQPPAWPPYRPADPYWPNYPPWYPYAPTITWSDKTDYPLK